MSPGSLDLNSLNECYFSLGFGYSEILDFLFLVHGIRISFRQLERILLSKGLRRRRNHWELREIIEREFEGSVSVIGYWQMHQRFRIDDGLVINRETVWLTLKTLDPSGVERRSQHKLKRRSYSVPNFLWQLDGYANLNLLDNVFTEL